MSVDADFGRGRIATGSFAVGLAVEDLDAGGRLEVVTGEETGGRQQITWYQPRTDLRHPWQRHIVDLECDGSAHDILFADMDGDGRRELVANAAYCDSPGLFIYKPGADLAAPWNKHAVDRGVFAEGVSMGDLDGDGAVPCGRGSRRGKRRNSVLVELVRAFLDARMRTSSR